MASTVVYTKQNYSFLNKKEVFKNCYVFSNNDEEFTDGEFNGSGIFNGNFYNHKDKLQDKLNINTDIVDGLQMNMKGSLCLFTKGIDNEFFIVPDPLGSAIVFYYDSPTIKIFSTSIQSILDTLEKIEVYPEKNIDYFLEVISLGKSGFIESPYLDIHCLKPFQYVTFNPDDMKIETNKKLESKIEMFKVLTENQLVDEIENELKNSINIISNTNNMGDKICHLTGGFDSRLVSSIIINQNLTDKFYFACSGRKGMKDKDIAMALSKHFGLIHTAFSGNISLKRPENYQEEILWSLDYSQGLLANLNPHVSNENNIILSGGYGESYRSFYGSDRELGNYKSYEELALELWPKLNYNSKKSLVKKEFVDSFITRFRNILLDGHEMGIKEDAVLDYLYFRVRNRYFVGQISYFNSLANSRFDPLYSVNAVLGSLYQKQDIRKNNVLGLLLLQKFSSELLALPFDYDRIPEFFEQNYGKVYRKNFKNNYNFEEYRKEIPKVEMSSTRLKPTKKHEEKAKKLNAWLYQVAEEDNARNGLKNVLSNINTTEKNKYFNLTYINNLLEKDINNRVDLRNLHTLYRNLLWLEN